MRFRFDLLALLTLCLIFISLTVLLWNRNYNNSLFDFGREAYIPQQMLKGAVLYKDIFNLYGPLSYQVNTVLFVLFGVNLNVLYLAGAANGLLIVLLFYGISRFLQSPFTSLGFSLAIALIFIFHNHTYISPYSFAIVYASPAILAATISVLFYNRNRKLVFLYLSFFFYGLSLAYKYEYIAFGLLLFLLVLQNRRLIKVTHIFVSFISFLLAPSISFLILFAQGVRLQDLIFTLRYIITFTSTPSLKFFYSNYSLILPNFPKLYQNIVYFLAFSACFTSFYFICKKLFRLFKTPTLPPLQLFVTSFLVSCSIIIIDLSSLRIDFITNFSWLPSLTLFLTFLIYLTQRKTQQPNTSLLLLSFAAVLFSLKSFFFAPFLMYGVHLFPLAFLIVMTFFRNLIDPKGLAFTFSIIFISSFIFICSFFSIPTTPSPILVTPRGSTSHLPLDAYLPLTSLLSYLTANSQINQLLVIPEGHLINFLSGIPSDNLLAMNLLPPNVQTYGEEKIISRLNSSRLKYLLLIRRPVNEFLTNDYSTFLYFGTSYGKKIMAYINRKYVLEKTFGTTGFLKLYRLVDIK